MKEREEEYERYIDRLVTENRMNLDDVLLIDHGDNITVKDFIRKTKIMQPWHRRLLENLNEIQEIHGDIREYMRRYVDEKTNDGFEFKGQEMGKEVEKHGAETNHNH